MKPLEFCTASSVLKVLEYDPFKVLCIHVTQAYLYLNVCFQHVNINDLNFKLCDYELEIEAFASFRTRQLQAPRTLFTDFSTSYGNDVDFEEFKGDRASTQSFLEDLHVVRVNLHSNAY